MIPTGFCYNNPYDNDLYCKSLSYLYLRMELYLRTILCTIVPYPNMCNLFPFQHSTSCGTVFAGGGNVTIEQAYSKALKEARKKMRLTQQKAAELCKLSPREYGDLERGKRIPAAKTLLKIYRALGVDLYKLDIDLPEEE